MKRNNFIGILVLACLLLGSVSAWAKVYMPQEKSRYQEREYAVFELANGFFTVTLDEPNSFAAQNFKDKVKSGFYNGLMFHHVVPGYLVQAGDATAVGRMMHDRGFYATPNAEKHYRGTVGMAKIRKGLFSEYQFYITTERARKLDGDYLVIGEVTQGVGLLSKIRKGDAILRAQMLPVKP